MKHHLSPSDKNVIILMIALIAVIILFVVIQFVSLKTTSGTTAAGQTLNPAAEDVTVTEGRRLTSSQTTFEVIPG